MTLPAIDPATGKPAVPAGSTSLSEFVPKAEFDSLKQRLDVFEQSANRVNSYTPPTPVMPSGPTLDERLDAFDKQIDALDIQIDKLSEEGKPFSALLKQRDKLNSAKLRLEIKSRDIDPALAGGMQAIDFLSGEVTRGKMLHYDIVKNDMEAQLASLDPSQRMNPQVRQKIYELSVGMNIDKIVRAKEEEVLRSVTANPDTAGGGKNSRSSGVSKTGYSEGVPHPKELLGPEALSALKMKGVTVDQEFQRRGYTGYEDWYQKVGKKYYSDSTEGGE